MFWAVVSLFVLGETILNGVFLSQGNELGLIGGIVSALVIMAINLAIAIFFSSLLRKANSVQKNQRIMAWSGMAVLLPTYLTFILLIGHYRDCVESDPFNASRQAVTDLLSTPFAIDDTFSWILILFSILMFIFFSLKFYRKEDAYPGYSRLIKNYKAAKQVWQDKKIEGAAQADKLMNKLIKDLHAIKQDIKKGISDFNASVNESNRLVESYHEKISIINNLLNSCIEGYQSNTARILDYKADYFGKTYRFEGTELPALNLMETARDEEVIKENNEISLKLDQVHDKSLKEANDIKAKLSSRLDMCFENIDNNLGIKP